MLGGIGFLVPSRAQATEHCMHFQVLIVVVCFLQFLPASQKHAGQMNRQLEVGGREGLAVWDQAGLWDWVCPGGVQVTVGGYMKCHS